ncbi:Aprt [Trypoxylus dichotomus]
MNNDASKVEIIKKHISSYPDFPKKGIIFRDLFSVLREPSLFTLLKEILIDRVKRNFPDVGCIAALDSRGFLLGPLIALDLQLPFVPIRKRGKLPGKVISVEYSLEYGKDALEIQEGSLKSGEKVLLVDDLLATGGSLKASSKLIEKCEAVVVGCLVVMEIEALKGAAQITAPLHSIIKY